MYVPTTLAQPAVALAPVGIVSTAPPNQEIGQHRHQRPQYPPERARRTSGRRHRHVATRTGRADGGTAGAREPWLDDRGSRTGNAKGRFQLRYVPRRTGSRARAPALLSGDALNLGAHRRLGWLNVYRLAEASWYGGGGGLACGGSLTSATMGVANKTLPCGTLVTLRYGGRSVRVPVVDRGPYVAGREFDLTQATKQALGLRRHRQRCGARADFGHLLEMTANARARSHGLRPRCAKATWAGSCRVGFRRHGSLNPRMSVGVKHVRTNVWLEGLGEWSWPGRGAVAIEVLPPAWVPALPPRLERFAAAPAAATAPVPWHSRRAIPRRLGASAFLSCLAAACVALTLAGPARLLNIVGVRIRAHGAAAVAPSRVGGGPARPWRRCRWRHLWR